MFTTFQPLCSAVKPTNIDPANGKASCRLGWWQWHFTPRINSFQLPMRPADPVDGKITAAKSVCSMNNDTTFDPAATEHLNECDSGLDA
jgi:hypothetical protein